MKTITYNTYKFDELSEEAQEHAIEKLRYINVEDSFWYDYDGKTGFTAKELKRMKLAVKDAPDELLKFKDVYFDTDRSWYIQFTNCHFSDDEIARKFLCVPADIWERVYWSFETIGRDATTKLVYEWQGDKELTKRQEEILDRAVEIFSDKMEEALKGLRNAYEWNLTDEAVKETILCNEYDFTEDGNLDQFVTLAYPFLRKWIRQN